MSKIEEIVESYGRYVLESVTLLGTPVHLRKLNKEQAIEAINRLVTEAKIEALDHVIDLEDKTFNRWSQKDIANFFDGVGKYYRKLQSTLKGDK